MKKAPVQNIRRPPARDRLLQAAAKVFGRDGLEGATTRAIARQAGVNEVTLFRLFRTKENLLAEVLGRTFNQPEATPAAARLAVTGDLRADLKNFVRLYESMLTENLPLIRTLVGEIHRHRPQERKVAEGIFRPVRTELVACLQQAQRRGLLRHGASAEVTADLLAGMVFTDVLRRCSPTKALEYSREEYLGAAVDILLRGIEEPGRA